MVSANDVDRLFLQAVLSRGLMSTTLARVLWQKSVSAVNSSCFFFVSRHSFSTDTDIASNNALNLPQSNDDESWIVFMDRINGSIDKLELQLRTIRDESSGKEMCALVGVPPLILKEIPTNSFINDR